MARADLPTADKPIARAASLDMMAQIKRDFSAMVGQRTASKLCRKLQMLPNGFYAFCFSMVWAIMFGFVFHHLEGWTAWRSFIFACVVISTIGYGQIVPVTVGGKVCTIVCGLAIPVFVFSVGWSGEVLRHVVQSSIDRGARACGRRKISQQVRGLIYTVLMFVYFFQAIGIYVVMEEWSWLDATYYVFCVFSTIGFGDYVPVDSNGYEEMAPFTWYHLWHFVCVFIGLGIIGWAFEALFEGSHKVAKRLSVTLDQQLGRVERRASQGASMTAAEEDDDAGDEEAPAPAPAAAVEKV